MEAYTSTIGVLHMKRYQIAIRKTVPEMFSHRDTLVRGLEVQDQLPLCGVCCSDLHGDGLRIHSLKTGVCGMFQAFND